MFAVAHAALWFVLGVVPAVISHIHRKSFEDSDLTAVILLLFVVLFALDYPVFSPLQMLLEHWSTDQNMYYVFYAFLLALLAGGTVQWFLVGSTVGKLVTVLVRLKKERGRSAPAPPSPPGP